MRSRAVIIFGIAFAFVFVLGAGPSNAEKKESGKMKGYGQKMQKEHEKMEAVHEKIKENKGAAKEKIKKKVKEHAGKRLDTNGDGKTTKDEVHAFMKERKELRKSIQSDRLALVKQFKEDRKALREQYDANGDGKLTGEERKAAKDAFATLRKDHMKEFSQFKDESKDSMKNFWDSYGKEEADEAPAE